MARVPRILIAFDDSPSAGAAVERAAALFPGAPCVVASVAARLDDLERSASAARVALSDTEIHVAIDRLRAAALGHAQELAERGARLAADAGLEAHPDVVASDGSVADALVEAARKHDMDVLVCGTRGRGAAARAILGSVSSSLVRHAGMPVLVVPAEAAADDGPVLIGFDGSEHAERAVVGAARVFSGGEALVVTAWRSQVRHTLTGRALEHSPLDDLRDMTESLDTAIGQAIHEDAEGGAALAREHGLDATPLAVESGDAVSQVLLATAQEQRARAIAVGRRGRNAAMSALLGSVSASVLHATDRPVLVV